MDNTYKVRGPDGKEYGPVKLEQLTTWLRESRVTPQHEVKRDDMEHWAWAADFAELKPALPGTASPVAPAPVTADDAAKTALLTQLKSGGSWFYWIAALSLINSMAALMGSDWRFIIGLGITQVIDAFGNEFGSSGKIIAFVLDLMVAGTLVVFGIFANKAQTWAFVIGMALYALDGLLSLLVSDWIGLAFHGFVLFCLFRGFTACRELNRA